MSASQPGLVLASASPRRRALLEEAGIAFTLAPSHVSEDLEGPLSAPDAAECLARRKAQAVAEEFAGEAYLVLGADTVVAVPTGSGPLDVVLLGKPESAAEARAMLERLSGTRHAVVTGVCVVAAETGVEWTAHERTEVTMRAIEPDEIEAYVASEEWRDKAGGYAIQETADRFVTRLEGGGFDNVVGLPVGLTRELLAKAGGSAPGNG